MAPEKPITFGYHLPLQTTGGDRFDLTQFKGKVLVANVWATWYVPCLAEMPSLEALAARIRGDSRFAFVLISKDNKTNLERFLSSRGKPAIPLALLGPDVEIPGAEGPVPVTFIVAPDGKVKVRERGATDWNADRVANFVRSGPV
jgi:thiol-disulfide isomerase/thioredoxin